MAQRGRGARRGLGAKERAGAVPFGLRGPARSGRGFAMAGRSQRETGFARRTASSARSIWTGRRVRAISRSRASGWSWPPKRALRPRSFVWETCCFAGSADRSDPAAAADWYERAAAQGHRAGRRRNREAFSCRVRVARRTRRPRAPISRRRREADDPQGALPRGAHAALRRRAAAQSRSRRELSSPGGEEERSARHPCPRRIL